MALLARWRADQLVYEDTSGTDAVEDTDAVAAWGIADGSLAGSLATQSTSGRRPVYAANDGGYPSLTFSNANKSSLLLAHSAAWVLSALTWLVVVKPTKSTVQANVSGNGVIVGKGASWANFGVHVNQFLPAIGTPANVIWQHDSYSQRVVAITAPANSNDWMVLCGCADASGVRMCLNRQSSVRIAQTKAVALGTASIAIGADADNTAYSMGGPMREVAFWDTALDESEMAAEIDAAMSRWGVTNTVEPPASGVTGFTGLSGLSGRLGT